MLAHLKITGGAPTNNLKSWYSNKKFTGGTSACNFWSSPTTEKTNSSVEGDVNKMMLLYIESKIQLISEPGTVKLIKCGSGVWGIWWPWKTVRGRADGDSEEPRGGWGEGGKLVERGLSKNLRKMLSDKYCRGQIISCLTSPVPNWGEVLTIQLWYVLPQLLAAAYQIVRTTNMPIDKEELF